MVAADQHFAGLGIAKVLREEATHQALGQRLDHRVAVLDVVHFDTVVGTAILFADDDVLRHVDETTGQITRVSGTQCGVSQAFPGATGGNEVLKDVQAFTVVGTDRHLNRATGGVGDQTAHTGELADLSRRTTGAGIRHHEDGVVGIHVLVEGVPDLFGGLVPHLHHFLVALVLAHKALIEHFGDAVDLRFRVRDEFLLRRRDGRVDDRDGQRAEGGIMVALRFDRVQHLGGVGGAVHLDAAVDDAGQLFFIYFKVDLVVEHGLGVAAIHKAEILRNGPVEDDTADGGGHHAFDNLAVHLFGAAHLNARVQTDHAGVVRHQRFVLIAEHLVLALFALALVGQIVGTEHHVLRRHHDGFTVGGFEQVAGGQHEEAGFRLRLRGQRHVHSHLVAVEVRVERGADQRMQFDRAALDQHRLKRLNTQAVQRRRAVEHDRVIFNDDLQRVPHLGAHPFDHLAGGLDVARRAGLDQAFHHKRLEQFERHLLR